MIFEGKEHIVDEVRNGSIPWGEVVKASGDDQPGQARIHRVGQTETGIAPVEQLTHSRAGDEIEVVIAPGFLGSPANWCFWEREYPEDGALGPFPSRAAALDALALDEKQNRCHYHVSEAPELEAEFKDTHLTREMSHAIGSKAHTGNRRLDAVLRLVALAGRYSYGARDEKPVVLSGNQGGWNLRIVIPELTLELSGKDLFVVIDHALRGIALCTEKK